jgi:predicted nucleic acid-binding protein
VTLVDSDVLIAHLRGNTAARDWLQRMRTESPLAVSAVSVAELTGGMRSEERREVRLLLTAFKVEPVTDDVARRAGEFMRQYRRSHNGIGLGDFLIAATADVRGHELATLNIRHFPMFKKLKAPFALGNRST